MHLTILSPTSYRRCRLAPLEYKNTFKRPGLHPVARWWCLKRSSDPIASEEKASFPVPKNPTPAISFLGLRLRPFGPHPWPKIGGLASPNMTGWIRLYAASIDSFMYVYFRKIRRITDEFIEKMLEFNIPVDWFSKSFLISVNVISAFRVSINVQAY